MWQVPQYSKIFLKRLTQAWLADRHIFRRNEGLVASIGRSSTSFFFYLRLRDSYSVLQMAKMREIYSVLQRGGTRRRTRNGRWTSSGIGTVRSLRCCWTSSGIGTGRSRRCCWWRSGHCRVGGATTNKGHPYWTVLPTFFYQTSHIFFNLLPCNSGFIFSISFSFANYSMSHSLWKMAKTTILSSSEPIRTVFHFGTATFDHTECRFGYGGKRLRR